MKPENWDNLPHERRREIAYELLRTCGPYVIGQALAIASAVIKEHPRPHQEPSNVGNMEMIGECLFSLGYGVTKISEDALQRKADCPGCDGDHL